jgi:hypothetical protein
VNTPNVPICVAGAASHDLTKADQNGGYARAATSGSATLRDEMLE